MTCKDCIHSSVCKDFQGANLVMNYIYKENAEQCNHFKDKSKIIELPDDYHGKAYIKYEGEGYFPYSVIRIVEYRKKWLCVSRAEAEEKLKELNK